jgi:hypothetical protein
MRHTLLIALTATLPLYLGGCGGGNDTTAPPPDVAVPNNQVVAVPNTTVSPTPSPAAGPSGNLPSDLIASTNATQRVIRVLRNRPDPFALLPTIPSIEIPANATPPQPVPQVPTLPIPGSGSLAPIPQLVPTTPAIALPPPFQPTLARSVKVTGVVQIGNIVHAIVDAPNEPSSRYVQVGQRLSNGQILVKRIEMNQGSEPVVVLEQNGVEVTTAVGEGGTAPAAPTASAGSTSSPG